MVSFSLLHTLLLMSHPFIKHFLTTSWDCSLRLQGFLFFSLCHLGDYSLFCFALLLLQPLLGEFFYPHTLSSGAIYSCSSGTQWNQILMYNLSQFKRTKTGTAAYESVSSTTAHNLLFSNWLGRTNCSTERNPLWLDLGGYTGCVFSRKKVFKISMHLSTDFLFH